MKTQTTNSTIEIDIEIPLSLLQSFIPRRMEKKRFSQAQAFLNLVQHLVLFIKTGDDSVLNYSISSLAHEWNWSRTAVKKFLQTLQGYGMLTLSPHGRKVIPCLSEKAIKVISAKSSKDETKVQPAKAEMPFLEFEE